MISRPPTLDEVVARIADAVHPWRIVLFGSRARGGHHDESDYDLFVEVDDSNVSLRELEGRIRHLIHAELTFDLKVKRPGEIERRRDDPGTIEWDVAREGRVLYAAPSAPTDLKPPLRVAEPSPLPPESMHEWLEVAARDARQLEVILPHIDELAPTICGLSQQMCEKYMKALLVSRRVRPERTHNLGKLLVALRAAGCPMPGLDADCELLTNYAIDPRYPAGNRIKVEEARLASEAASRIVRAVRAELPI